MECKKVKVNLSGVNETMLIPLYARAIESQKKHPQFNDEMAIKIVNSLNYDFSKFSSGKMSMWGTIARTVIFDREAKKYIDKHPDCTVINVGCGLDTRFYRVDNGRIKWYNLDLGPVINIRKQVIKNHERVTTLEKSILDESWVKSIKKSEHVLFIIEGFFMYFEEKEVKMIFESIYKNFPKSTVLAEVASTFLIKNSNHHDTVSKTSAVFKWGIDDIKDVEKLGDFIKVNAQYNLTNGMIKAASIPGKVFINLIKPMLIKSNDRILDITFE